MHVRVTNNDGICANRISSTCQALYREESRDTCAVGDVFVSDYRLAEGRNLRLVQQTACRSTTYELLRIRDVRIMCVFI